MIGDVRGAALPEFGLVIIPLCIMLLGGMDMGYQIYVRSVMQGAVEYASRMTTLQTADSTAVEDAIRAQIKKIAPAATISITKGSFYQFSNINTMERITVDRNSNGTLDGPVGTTPGDCWEDIDDNGERNVVAAGKDGIGAADDVVRYTVVVTYKRLLPIYRFIGIPQQAQLTTVAMTKRQPYQGQTPPVERCKT
jgi:Flp pilus assembly protein TadG